MVTPKTEEKTLIPGSVSPSSRIFLWAPLILAQHANEEVSLVTLEGPKVKFDKDDVAEVSDPCKVLSIDPVVSWEPKVGATTKSGVLLRYHPDSVPFVNERGKEVWPKPFIGGRDVNTPSR